MEHKLPELPWPKDSLTGLISPETLEFHHGKHHKAYVDNLNKLIPCTEFAELSLEDIIKKSSGGIFNNAAQVWNHTFYWNCMTPKSSKTPSGEVSNLINQKWGSFDKFKEEFTKSATTNFGSGWTWLVKTNSGVEIVNTSNAGCPLTAGQKPLLTLDVWEHAYYIDHRNARAGYIEKWWGFVNWEFVNSQV